ncbi:LysR substrate-binding domain-containing protein [Paenibacillus chartarius]|uniref:LysR substrate-binding domain-containing protein n=1 Tax=Paenibacillus chartarius TaxID=747481 RepID=A0ABV6DV45_9BACL
METIASSAPFIHALSVFQRKYPEVSLSLVNGTSPKNYEMVLDRQLDGAFLTGEYDISSLQVAYEIEEEVLLLTSVFGKEDHSYPEVANATWVVFPKGCPLRKANEDWLQGEGGSFRNMIEVSTLDTMLSCVRAGIGYTFLTESVVDTDDEQLHIHRVPEPYRFLTTRLVSRKERFPSKAFAAFAHCVRTAGIGCSHPTSPTKNSTDPSINGVCNGSNSDEIRDGRVIVQKPSSI